MLYRYLLYTIFISYVWYDVYRYNYIIFFGNQYFDIVAPCQLPLWYDQSWHVVSHCPKKVEGGISRIHYQSLQMWSPPIFVVFCGCFFFVVNCWISMILVSIEILQNNQVTLFSTCNRVALSTKTCYIAALLTRVWTFSSPKQGLRFSTRSMTLPLLVWGDFNLFFLSHFQGKFWMTDDWFVFRSFYLLEFSFTGVFIYWSLFLPGLLMMMQRSRFASFGTTSMLRSWLRTAHRLVFIWYIYIYNICIVYRSNSMSH